MENRNMTEMIEIETGYRYIGFVDYDKLQSKYIFVYFDKNMNSWTSNTLGHFKPYEKEEVKLINEDNEPNMITEGN